MVKISVKFALIFFCFLLSLVVRAQDTLTLRIDPDNAEGGYATEIFDSIKFIPLETTKESLFSDIDQMEVTDDYFIILDQQTKSVLLFRKDGKYSRKLHAESPFQDFGYFSLNRFNNTISVIAFTDSKQYILTYNFDGALLEKQDVPDGIRIQSLWGFDKDTILYNFTRPASLSDVTRYDLAYSRGSNNIYKKLKPYNSRFVNQDYNTMSNFFNYSGESGSVMFSMPYEYNIFQLNSKGIVKNYNFIFPYKYSLPQNFATDSVFTGKRAKFMYSTSENFGKFECVSHVYKLGSYMLFTAKPVLKATYDGNFLYNFKTGRLISFGRVTGDSSSSYLPIMSHSYLEELKAVYKNSCFTSIPPSILFSIKEHADGSVNYNQFLSNFYSVAKKNDNPVIIQFKLKEGL